MGKEKKGKIMRSLTHPPFSPWQLQGQGQSKSQTPELCCQRECLPASTFEQACHAVNGCIKHKHTIVSSCSTKLHHNLHNDSPNLPRFSAMVHHRQDATRGFENRHSVLISVKKTRSVRKKLKQETETVSLFGNWRFPSEITHFFFFFLMYLSWAYSVLSLNVELLSISCWTISCESHHKCLKMWNVKMSSSKKHFKNMKYYI